MTPPADPVVSVVVPTFRRPDYLRISLGSVLAQTYPHLEVIVADDGGDQETLGVVRSFVDDRIVHLRREQRLGITPNIVDAFRASSSNLVMKVDDDDVWHESIVERLLFPLRNDDDVVVAFSDHFVIDASGNVLHRFSEENSRSWGRSELPEGKHQPFFDLTVRGTIPMQLAALFRKDSVDWQDFPADVGALYDRWLSYLLCRTGAAAFYVPERLAYYRTHEGSETATGRVAMNRANVFCYDAFMGDQALGEVRRAARRTAAQHRLDLALAVLRESAPGEGRALIRQSLRMRPSLRGGAALAFSALPPSVRSRAFRWWAAAGRTAPAAETG